MSQDYFPPQGTKFKWEPKVLNYSSWSCDVLAQIEGTLDWPASITLYADILETGYVWRVLVRDWAQGKHSFEGTAESALGACLEAEAVGALEASKLYPDWVRKALQEGWRPPG
jgi:hypothetical protein